MAESIPKPTLLFGTFDITTGGSTQVIPITGMTSSGIVSVVYVQSGNSRVGNYLKRITTSLNEVSVEWSTSCLVGETIIWNVLSYY